MEATQPGFNDRTAEHHTPVPGWNWDNVFDKIRLFVLLLIKLLLNLSMLVSCFLCLSLVAGVQNTTFIVVLICLAIFIDLVDIIIGLMVIISVFMEYQRIMKMYYKFSIYIFVVLSIFCCVLLFITLRGIEPVINLLFFLFLALLMQLYLNYSIKNEVMKLRSNEHRL